MHDESFAALVADLEGSDKRKIRFAVDGLIALATDSTEVKAALERRLEDPLCKNRWALAYILGNLAQPWEAVVRTLLEALDHSDSEIRWAIGLLLVRLGKTDATIVDRLVELLAKGLPRQRRMAVYCIRDLAPAGRATLEPLLHALKDEDSLVRVAAAISLKIRADVDEGGRRALLDLFVNDPDIRVQNVAAIVLAHLGSPSGQFLAALESATKNENAQIKKAALAALALLHNKRSAPSDS